MSGSNNSKLRVLFCIAVSQNLFDLPAPEIPVILQAYTKVFGDMAGLPGLTVIGTFDDDRVMVGGSSGWPWTSYVLADVDSLDTAIAACNLFRSTRVGQERMWKYGRIEARIGRELNLAAAAQAS